MQFFLNFFPFIEFWPRRATTFTAPVVKFKNKVYAEVILKDAETGLIDNRAFAASTLKPVHEAGQFQLAPLIVTAYGKEDSSGRISTNDNTFYEQWNLTVTLRLPENKVLHTVDLLTAFDYVTEGDVMMKMEALASMHCSNHQVMNVRKITSFG